MTPNRILLTGAGGLLGGLLRRALAGQFQLLRLSDIVPLREAREGEEIVTCDLADAAAVEALCEGIDAVIHLGGIPREAEWPELLRSNIVGTLNRAKAPPVQLRAPVPPKYDGRELYGVIPTDPRKPFDVREIIARIVDGS